MVMQKYLHDHYIFALCLLQVIEAKLIKYAKTQANRDEWVSQAQNLVKEWWDEMEALYSSNAFPIRPERQEYRR